MDGWAWRVPATNRYARQVAACGGASEGGPACQRPPERVPGSQAMVEAAWAAAGATPR